MPSRDVVAVRVANEPEKETLIEMDPDAFFPGTPATVRGLRAVLA